MRWLQESQRCHYDEFHPLNRVITVECRLSEVVRTDCPHIWNYLQNTLWCHRVDWERDCRQIKLATEKSPADLTDKVLIRASIFCDYCLVCERDATLFICLHRPEIVHKLGGFEGCIFENACNNLHNSIIRHAVRQRIVSVALRRCVVVNYTRRRRIQKLVFAMLDNFKNKVLYFPLFIFNLSLTWCIKCWAIQTLIMQHCFWDDNFKRRSDFDKRGLPRADNGRFFFERHTALAPFNWTADLKIIFILVLTTEAGNIPHFYLLTIKVKLSFNEKQITRPNRTRVSPLKMNAFQQLLSIPSLATKPWTLDFPQVWPEPDLPTHSTLAVF